MTSMTKINVIYFQLLLSLDRVPGPLVPLKILTLEKVSYNIKL